MKILCSLCAILLSGCASDQAFRYYTEQRYPSKPAQDVQLLRGEPSLPYEVLADFQFRHGSVAHLRKLAAQIGADAVIVTLAGGYASLTQEWAANDTLPNSYSHIIGTAIKYKETK